MSNYNPFSLEGKTVLVTGASSGIGRATAIECSRLGAKVVATGRNAERLQETMQALEGEGHSQIIAELTSADDVARLVRECPALNGLVLCAGLGNTLPLQFCTREKMNSVFDINFFAPVELLRLLAKGKKLEKGASVVAISSIAGTPNGGFSPGNGTYGASKAALLSLMRFAAIELAPRKIRVNTVNPGMVETKMIHGAEIAPITQEQLAADVQKYPLKRYGQPNDVAYGVIYLLSDAASWVTGHSLVIDGGVTI